MPALDGQPNLAVETAPPALVNLVQGVNNFLFAMSDAGAQAKQAVDQGGSQLAMMMAADRLGGFAADAGARRQALAESFDAGAADQLTGAQRDLVNAVGDEIGRMTGDDLLQAPEPSGALDGLRAQLDANLTDVASRLAALDAPGELTREAGADAYAERTALQGQHAVLDQVKGLADTASSLANDLRATEVIAINRTAVGEPNADPRAAGDRVMDGVKAKDVAGPDAQWMHLLARCLGGVDAQSNLVAGDASQNQRMLKLELGLRDAVAAGREVHVEIGASVDRDTRKGDELFYRVDVDGAQIADIRFDLQQRAPLDHDTRAQITDTLRDMRDALANDRSPLEAIERLAELIQADADVRNEIEVERRAQERFDEETSRQRK